MRRRTLLLAGLGTAVGGGVLWLAGTPPAPAGFRDLDGARRWLASLGTTAHTTAGWPLPAVLEHAAQSVEYALDGYPRLEPAWFRAGPGALAARVFARAGAMRHDLDEPIPGAPPLTVTALAPAQARLDAALARFAAHRGALAPHFAYGALDHAGYARAHLLHLADHARRIAGAPPLPG